MHRAVDTVDGWISAGRQTDRSMDKNTLGVDYIGTNDWAYFVIDLINRSNKQN